MAQVRFMSLLVALAWSTFTVLCVVVLSTDPSIPHNVTAVRICKGDTISPHSHCTMCPARRHYWLQGCLPSSTRRTRRTWWGTTSWGSSPSSWSSSSSGLVSPGSPATGGCCSNIYISTHIPTYLQWYIYRKRHNQSYFLSYRQNIATIDQTIYYAYLKVS